MPHKARKFVPKLVTYKLTKREKRYLRFRDRLIRLLGLAPEDRSSPEERYAATTSEFHKWTREKYRRK